MEVKFEREFQREELADYLSSLADPNPPGRIAGCRDSSKTAGPGGR